MCVPGLDASLRLDKQAQVLILLLRSHQFAVTSTEKIRIYGLTAPEEKGTSDLEEVRTISRDVVTAQAKLSFRAARFGRGPTASQLLAVLNAPPPSKRGGPRKAFVASFTFGKGSDKPFALERTRVLAAKPVTVVDLSACGSRLAYGCSDLSVGIVDATTFGVSWPSHPPSHAPRRLTPCFSCWPYSPSFASCAHTSCHRQRSASTRPEACFARPAPITRSASMRSRRRLTPVSLTPPHPFVSQLTRDAPPRPARQPITRRWPFSCSPCSSSS
jgi:hypothetical protein